MGDYQMDGRVEVLPYECVMLNVSGMMMIILLFFCLSFFLFISTTYLMKFC